MAEWLPVTITRRIFAGVDFDISTCAKKRDGSDPIDADFEGWVVSADFRRDPRSPDDSPETFVPVVTRTGAVLNAHATAEQTANLKSGRALLRVYATRGDAKELLVRATVYVDDSREI